MSQTRNNNNSLFSPTWSLEHLKQRQQDVCWGCRVLVLSCPNYQFSKGDT